MDFDKFKSEEISVFCIISDLIRNLWIIVLVAISIWIGFGSVAEMVYVPEYTAEATVAVGSKGKNTNSLNSLNVTKQMAGAFGEVFSSDVLMDKVKEDLKGERVNGTISAEAINETNLMVVKAVSDNPRTSYLMLQSAFENYENVSGYLFSNVVLRIVKEPSVPFSPSNGSFLKENRTIAALVVAVLTAAGIVLLSLFRLTVKTKTCARENLDGSILGMIAYERKGNVLQDWIRPNKKKALLISSAAVSMSFTESYRKLAARLEHHMKKREQKVLLITSVSENEGKSSVAANIALALALKGRKVLLLDLDLKKPVQDKMFSNTFEIQGNLKEYFTGEKTVEEVKSYSRHLGLYAVFQHNGIDESGKWASSDKISQLLRHYRDKMDYIILDTSPMAVAVDAEYLMTEVDTVALVVRQDWTDIGSINEAADNIRQSKKDFAGFILNAFVDKDAFSAKHQKYEYYRYKQRGESDAK